MTERNLQIGVVGSMADLRYGEELEYAAGQLGQAIAEQGYTLIFGAERDSDSLPTVAARAAKRAGGLVVGVSYEKGLEVFDNDACSVVVATGLVRGGGREMVQSLCCDGVIAIAGGSGTLNEVSVAYQAGIPVVCMTGYGGWSEQLAGTFLDARSRYEFGGAASADQAITNLINMIEDR